MGKIKDLIYDGVIRTTSLWKVILLLYSLLLIGSLPLSYFLGSRIGDFFGHRIATVRNEGGLARTPITEFLQENPGFLGRATFISLICLIVYTIIKVWTDAGLYASLAKKKNSLSSFYRLANNNVLPFSGLTFIFIAAKILWSILVLGAFFLLAGNPLQDYTNEGNYIILLGLVIIIWALGMVFLVLWSVFSKYCIIDGCKVSASIRKGVNNIKYHWSRVLCITSIFIVLWLLSMVISKSIWSISSNSTIGLYVSSILLQLVVVIRIFIGTTYIASLASSIEKRG